MSNYTMTFYCRDCLPVPDASQFRPHRNLHDRIRSLMGARKLELVDFNLTENYQTYPEYHSRGRHKTIVEIRLDLNRMDLVSRESIYNRCLMAINNDELYLSDYSETGSEANAVPENLFVFDMKSHRDASESA
ncbi:hypothetical protein ACLI09_03665 [Flavobacterium sp. RHBU_24]|uniref:hypothetical protein n=1 Tax=Flavobacterium sp. RHBU_24 TaxID=3391185 RepID=UPI003984FD90